MRSMGSAATLTAAIHVNDVPLGAGLGWEVGAAPINASACCGALMAIGFKAMMLGMPI